MKKIISIMFLGLLCSNAFAEQVGVNLLKPEVTIAIDNAVSTVIAGIASGSTINKTYIGIVYQGQIVYTKCYFSATNVATYTQYWASVTKMMTKLIIQKMIHDGLISSWDADVWDYCPEYQGWMPTGYTTLKLLHIGNHTSGLPGGGRSGEVSTSEIVTANPSYTPPYTSGGKLILHGTPGDYAGNNYYSSKGLSVLGDVIEAAGNMSYYNAVTQYIANPVGATSLHNRSTTRANLTLNPTTWWDPSGWITSTILDYAKVNAGLVNHVYTTEAEDQYMYDNHLWLGNPQGHTNCLYHTGSNGIYEKSFFAVERSTRNGVVCFLGGTGSDEAVGAIRSPLAGALLTAIDSFPDPLLNPPTGPSITGMSDVTPSTGQAVTITGARFLANTEQALVRMGNAATYTACTTFVNQTVTSWTDTSIGITFNDSGATGQRWMYVVDQNGLKNASGFSVTLNVSLPTISFTTPASSPSSTGTQTFTIAGISNPGDTGTITSVTWSNSRGGSLLCTGTTSWTAPINLCAGVNIITVTALRDDGTSASASSTITLTGNGIQDLVGNDLANFTNFPVTNGSEVPSTVIYPTVTACSVNVDGNELSITLSASCTGNNGFNFMASGSLVGLTYASGTGTSRKYTPARIIQRLEPLLLGYSPGNIINGSSVAMQTFSNRVVSNGSEQGGTIEVPMSPRSFGVVVYGSIVAAPVPPGYALDSSFECGNGVAGTPFQSGNEVNIITECDPSPGDNSWGDWFYFSLSNVSGDAPIVNINFSNDRGGGPLWNTHGSVRPVYSYDKNTWQRISSVTYSTTTHILRFTMPTMTSGKVYVAMDYPYSYANLQSDISVWDASPYCTSEALSYSGISTSQGGRNIYYLKVEEPGYYLNRVELVITGRTHSGEPQGSHHVKGFMDWILSSDLTAIDMRRKSILYVFPMVNPDGVVAGRVRSFNDGLDANRGYDTGGPNSTNEPRETFLVHSKINAVNANVRIGIDSHSNNYASPRIVYDTSCDDWTTEDINRVLLCLNANDTPNYWYNAFYNMPATDTTGFRCGQITQYGYYMIGIEGGIYADQAGIYPTALQRQTAAGEFIKSIIQAFYLN